LAEFASNRSTENAYPSYMDGAIAELLEIKADNEVLNNVLLQMQVYFKKISDDTAEQSKFYQLTKKIYLEIHHKLDDIFRIFGSDRLSNVTDIQYSDETSYQSTKKRFIDNNIKEMRNVFMKKYSLKVPGRQQF
jgi:hypothetical protein